MKSGRSHALSGISTMKGTLGFHEIAISAPARDFAHQLDLDLLAVLAHHD
jgi:hypothetical protein